MAEDAVYNRQLFDSLRSPSDYEMFELLLRVTDDEGREDLALMSTTAFADALVNARNLAGYLRDNEQWYILRRPSAGSDQRAVVIAESKVNNAN